MIIDANKLDLELARQCMNASDLKDAVSPATITRIRQGHNVGTKTAGRIAHALNMPLSKLLDHSAAPYRFGKNPNRAGMGNIENLNQKPFKRENTNSINALAH